ncbi:MAG: RNA-binding S4 domain-containing protein [Acidobacteriota bacterium]|nr:RNA-binding S4 domain-containing protein [Acidobacteriota bacterium]
MPGNENLEAVRLDRWLFAVRIFKTRTLAAKAIDGGTIKLNGVPVKSHKAVRLNDVIQCKREGRTFEYKVLGLLEKRVGAKEAAPCYEVTEDADLNPEMREMIQLYREVDRAAPKSKGRPSKRDRRQMERFRGKEDEL